MPINTSGLSGYAAQWANAYNSSMANGGNVTSASNAANTAANQATYGSSAPNASQQQSVRNSLSGGSNYNTTGGSYNYSPSSSSHSSSGTGYPNSTGSAVQPSANNYSPSSSPAPAQSNSGYNFNMNNASASDLMRELGRAQTAWNQYNSANDAARANDAASYGQQLRSRLTSLGYNAGNQDYRGLWNQYAQQNGINGAATPYVQSSNPNANYQTLTTQAQGQPTAPAAAVNPYAALSPQLISQLFQPYQPIDYTQQAANAANPIVNEYKNNYNSLLSKLDSQRSNDLGAVQNSTEDAKSALENQYFQNYLGARQAMADRGLAGSGLANDQDTRLLLAKQQDLAGIYRDAALQQSDINNNYTNNYNDVQNQLAQVNSGQIQNQILQQLQSQGYSQYKDQQSNLANLFKDILPYAAPQQDTILNNQTSMYKTNADNLNKLYTTAMNNGSSTYNNTMDNQVKTALGMLPYQYQTANNKADNATKAVTNAIDMFKAQNQASYQNGMLSIDGQRLSLDQAKFADSKDRFATEIQQKADALKNTQWNQQAQHQASLAKGYLDQAAAYQKQLSGMDSSDPMYSSVKANYDSAMQNATNAYNGLASLNNGGDGSATTDTSTAGFPTSGTPSGSFSNFLVGQ